MVIQVDLRYTNVNTKLRLSEHRELDVGLPLIASCNFSQKSPEASHYTVGPMTDNIKPSDQAVHAVRPSSRKAENIYLSIAKEFSGSTNEPEENDENDLQSYQVGSAASRSYC